MSILFIQTADAIRYRRFLEITSTTVREFAARSGSSYMNFIGIRRGYHSWQATFNRIPLLWDLLQSGNRGWVVYLDADAYVHDLNFPITDYFSDKKDIAFVAAPSGVQPQRWWDVNAGVFAVNLGHDCGHAIISRWHELFNQICDDDLLNAAVWDQVANDQSLLHQALQDVGAEYFTLVDNARPRVFNCSDATFIRQVLRAGSTYHDRILRLEETVDSILANQKGFQSNVTGTYKDVPAIEQEFVESVYAVLLLRGPDRDGLASGLKRIRVGGKTMAQELQSCLESKEFRSKLPQFLGKYCKGLDNEELDKIIELTQQRKK